MHHVISALAGLLCCFALAAGETSYLPAPATIFLEGREQAPADLFVIHEDMDKLQCAMDRQGTSKTAFDYDKVARVEYADTSDAVFKKAEYLYNNGQWETAAAAFGQAAESAPEEWVAIRSLLLRAECLGQIKQVDQALASIDQLVKTFPRSVKVPQALYLKGQLLLQAGRAGEATAAFDQLAGRAGEFTKYSKLFGELAKALSALGRASVLRAAGKSGEAANAILGVFGGLNPDRFPEEFVHLGVALAECQAESKQREPALATWKRLCFEPVGGAVQSRAHYEIARLLKEAGQATAALDHALMAAARSGADRVYGKKARDLATELLPEIRKDERLGPEEKREYAGYLRNL